MGNTKSKPRIIVAAIDFGTTFSGYAFSFKHDYDKEPTKVESKYWYGGGGVSQKAPTAVLIHPDGERIHSFGYAAEDKYADLSAQDDNEHEKWFFFKHFKMKLFSDKGVSRDLMLEDAFGKKLSAKLVFGLSIKYLKENLFSESKQRVTGIFEDDIHWVLTVPAIWNDAAKQFMREAAKWAGIPDERLTIALEPECASIYCRHIPMHTEKQSHSPVAFSTGTKYMILDAGGGTVDISLHEVTKTGCLRALCKPSGGAWGGTRVDAAFKTILDDLFGKEVMLSFEKKEMEDHIALFRDFELKKMMIEPDAKEKVTIKIPASIYNVYKEEKGRKFTDDFPQMKYASMMEISLDKLRIESSVVQDCFAESIGGTLEAIGRLLRQRSAARCSTIVMVGGLSESDIYKEAVKKKFPRLKVVSPQDGRMAVLKGAVMYGHVPSTICERVVGYTYGTDISHEYKPTCSHPVGKRFKNSQGKMQCYDIFSVFVKKGTTVALGQEQEQDIYYPLSDTQKQIEVAVYASSNENPQLVTESDCNMIGKLTVDITKPGTDQEFCVSMLFGGTEIEVRCVEKSTGKVTKATVNFLG